MTMPGHKSGQGFFILYRQGPARKRISKTLTKGKNVLFSLHINLKELVRNHNSIKKPRFNRAARIKSLDSVIILAWLKSLNKRIA